MKCEKYNIQELLYAILPNFGYEMKFYSKFYMEVILKFYIEAIIASWLIILALLMNLK